MIWLSNVLRLASSDNLKNQSMRINYLDVRIRRTLLMLCYIMISHSIWFYIIWYYIVLYYINILFEIILNYIILLYYSRHNHYFLCHSFHHYIISILVLAGWKNCHLSSSSWKKTFFKKIMKKARTVRSHARTVVRNYQVQAVLLAAIKMKKLSSIGFSSWPS